MVIISEGMSLAIPIIRHNSFLWLFLSFIPFSSVQLLSRVRLFATPWIAAHKASLSITNSRSSLRLTSIESVMPSSHLILCRPLLLLPPIPHSIRVFSNESTLHIRWPKYWSFSFSISPSNEYWGLFSFRIDWLDLLAVQGTLKSLLQHPSSKASILWPKGRRQFLLKFVLSCHENRNFISHYETSLLLNKPRAKYRVRLRTCLSVQPLSL